MNMRSVTIRTAIPIESTTVRSRRDTVPATPEESERSEILGDLAQAVALLTQPHHEAPSIAAACIPSLTDDEPGRR
jgi:hypothetical protein